MGGKQNASMFANFS